MKNILLFFVIVLNYSCSPVLIYENQDGEESYTLKLWETNRYTYIDRGKGANFKTKGDYKFTDTSLVLICPHDKQLPVGFKYSKFKITGSNTHKNHSNIKVQTSDNNLLSFATIAVYCKNNRLRTGKETSLDGSTSFTFSPEDDYLMIEYVGFQSQRVNVDDVRGKDFNITFPKFKMGGRSGSGCFAQPIDYLLEYQLGENIISANGWILERIK